MLCLLANRIVNNKHAAEDIVQDCFVKLWQKRGELEKIKGTTGYVCTVVRNHALNYKRDQRQDLSIDLTNEAETQNTLHDLIAAETHYQLFKAVQTLPSKCKEVFKYIYFEGKSNEEIALLMNTTESTVRNQKARSILLLRKKLKFL